jgi:hypothetical protein
MNTIMKILDRKGRVKDTLRILYRRTDTLYFPVRTCTRYNATYYVACLFSRFMTWNYLCYAKRLNMCIFTLKGIRNVCQPLHAGKSMCGAFGMVSRIPSWHETLDYFVTFKPIVLGGAKDNITHGPTVRRTVSSATSWGSAVAQALRNLPKIHRPSL